MLNLFQTDSSKTEMLLWPKLLFLKGISKATSDLILCVFLEGTNSSFTKNDEVRCLDLKFFMGCVVQHFLLLVASFVSLNFLTLIWCLELNFKQKRIQLFWVNCIFILFSGSLKGTKIYMHSHSAIELKNYATFYII